MKVITLPADLESVAAPAATLLEVLGPPWPWWTAALGLLIVGLLVLSRRPVLSAGLAVAASFAMAIAVNGLVDDAFIQFRHAANLAEGAGPVFNAGERIEGASGGLCAPAAE